MKAQNYSIKWHYRTCEIGGVATKETICVLKHDNKEDYGIAVCSIRDHFSRDKGRKLSLLRALKTAGVAKEERIPVWEAYRNMTTNKRW